MSRKDTGGPAFPTENGRQVGHDAFLYEGMTLRDYFAAKVLMGCATITDADLGTVKDIAETCYKLADAMMEARK